VIVRYELDNGADTYVAVPATMAEQITVLDGLAQGLLSLVPRATRIQVWADGRSFLDAPDATARPPQPEDVSEPDDLFLDVATAILLAQDQPNAQTGAPSWLTREAGCMPVRPDVLRGRAARSNTPPV
jgi:hypothetical protein